MRQLYSEELASDPLVVVPEDVSVFADVEVESTAVVDRRMLIRSCERSVRFPHARACCPTFSVAAFRFDYLDQLDLFHSGYIRTLSACLWMKTSKALRHSESGKLTEIKSFSRIRPCAKICIMRSHVLAV
jgi:hypothetical protein